MLNSIKGLLFLASFVMLISCDKDDDNPFLSFEEQLEVDLKIIDDYLVANGLTAEESPSGLRYIITEEGSGEHPEATDSVVVKYKGYYPSGEVFDQTKTAETAKFPLNRVIPGWTEGVQYLKTGGGKGVFLLPSYLAYGPSGSFNGAIPPNQVLFFDITLIDAIE